MRTLIQDLLVLSRVTSQARPFVSVDLAAIMQETRGDLEVAIAESGAEIVANDLPPVMADPAQVRQIFLNLIGNALKFRHEGAIPRVVVSGERAAEMVELRFEDNGIGLDEKYVDRIFKPFQRLHARDRYPGTGIGLAICRKIVERHGGSITVSSAPGRGATFIVTLPAAADRSPGADGEAR